MSRVTLVWMVAACSWASPMAIGQTGLEHAHVIRWRSGSAKLQPQDSAEVLTAWRTLAARSEKRHMILTFASPPTSRTRAALAGAGVELGGYLGGASFFASLGGAIPGATAAIANARLTGVHEIQTDWKIHPRLDAADPPEWAMVSRGGQSGGGGAGDAPSVIVVYVLYHRGVALLQEGIAVARRHGAVVRSHIKSVNGLVIELPTTAIRNLAGEDAVQWIEPAMPGFSEHNDRTRVSIQADAVQTDPAFNLSGEGVSVLLYDMGEADSGHPDFAGRLTGRDASAPSDHATHVAGTIGGSGLASGGRFRGMAPAVTIESFGAAIDGTQTPFVVDPGDLEADFAQAINEFDTSVANTSLGSNVCVNGFDCSLTGEYGVTSQLIDAIVGGSLGATITSVWSVGNERGCDRCRAEGVHTLEGYRSIAPPANAKNHITVGAVNGDVDLMTPFSSWGPTGDGRLKPDLVAPGCQISDDFAVTSTATGGGYLMRCGTSMAAPAVTGSVALLLEEFRVLFPDGMSLDAADPRPSTVKSLLIHTAADLEAIGPDFQTGFGAVRIKDAIEFLRTQNFLEGAVEQRQATAFLVQVRAGDAQLKVSLVWDDVPATPNVQQALVNDLDLRVFDPTGVRHYPWTLDANEPARPAQAETSDHANNVEQVVVESPMPGVWRVDVYGYQVPDGPQSFSVCASPRIAKDCDGNGEVDRDEIADNPSLDCSGNGLLDRCEPDCDGNGLADSCDIVAGALDCNRNDILDSCEVDCNGNGVPDDCDVLDGLRDDCNRNGVPDDCEADCNNNGVQDGCDVDLWGLADCDGDRVPDECQDTSADCNGNGLWDDCETASGDTPDENGNGVPDECELASRALLVDPGTCTAPGIGTLLDPFCKIQHAIDDSISGNTIILAEGKYAGDGNRNLDFGGRAITLRSSDPADPFVVGRTIIEAGGVARGFYFHSGESADSVVEGITIRRGVAAIGNVPGGNRGGGIYCENSSPTIRGCVIASNTVGTSLFATFGGAGICCQRASPTIEGCTIQGNRAVNPGGGIYALDQSRPSIVRTILIGNATDSTGGAIALTGGSGAQITDCLLAGNTAGTLGGAVFTRGGAVNIERTTISGNDAMIAGGGVHVAEGSVAVTNSILWNNAAPNGPEVVVEPGGALSVYYSDVQGGINGQTVFPGGTFDWGPGNLETDPRFVDAAGPDGDEFSVDDNDYHLSQASPCIDAGAPGSLVESGALDVDGDERRQNCRLDIGSDETALFADCNTNDLADACELEDGALADENSNNVPDVCETCVLDQSCDDGDFCNGAERCVDGLCVPGPDPCFTGVCDEANERCLECSVDDECDDGNACTTDACADQACLHTALPDCGPTVSLRAVAINGQPLTQSFGEPLGSTDWVSVLPGDRVTCDILLRNWAPRSLSAYQLTIDSSTFLTAPRGSVSPVVDPTPSAGAFINTGRADFVYKDAPAITVVSNTQPDYVFIGVAQFLPVGDPGRPAYAGTLTLRVADDAVGAFRVGFKTAANETFLNDSAAQDIGPLLSEPLTIRAEAVGCLKDPDCNDNGVWDACDLAIGFSQDCNATGLPDECDIADPTGSLDCDENGVPDECEPDCNGNGVTDRCDLLTGSSGDCNENGIPDDCEDCNRNQIADECDLLSQTSRDCNGNSLPDECDVALGLSPDCNRNNVPDECDIASFTSPDCNRNGVPDQCDFDSGISKDCNANAIPDECEDCNGNGIADQCDLEEGFSDDCNANNVPDECEDCDENGVADACEIADGSADDCNGNGVPDACEDCNGNGVADECDIESGTSDDRDRDGVPDECDLCAPVSCDDGLFCTGRESCEKGVCLSGEPPCAGARFCDEANGRCAECLTDEDCDDGNPCTRDFCEQARCRIANHGEACDDGDRCTVNDVCSTGGCGGARIEGCAAQISLRAVLVNDQPATVIAGNIVRAKPGDRITCEIHLDGWRPDLLRRYQAVIDSAGYVSAARGTLQPVTEPSIVAGGFIEQGREDFVFYQQPTLTAADKRSLNYRFESISVFDPAGDRNDPAYGGTLVLDVSDDAAGAFAIGFIDDPTLTFMEDGQGIRMLPLRLQPLIISVPPPGCENGDDCNDNGVADACDLDLGASLDCNGNDVPDECDVVKRGGSQDCTGNGIPDECESDCNANGVADSCDIQQGTSEDCNANGVPDTCEDCNQNGVADDCDVETGFSKDCNENGLPDECDLASATSSDCTGNRVPDECEDDCDENGRADSCDIAETPALDLDRNGFLDACQRVLRVKEDFFRIQDAIDAAQPGDHVVVEDGVYAGLRNRELNMRGKVVTVRSENGPSDCVIDLGGLGRGFVFESGETAGSVVEGFTIRGGRAVDCAFSSPTIRRCLMTGSMDGAIVCRLGSRPLITDCMILGNRAALGAGIFSRNSRPIVRHCTIADNTAEAFGGGIYADSAQPIITHSILWGNTALAGDQLALRFGADVSVTYSTVQGGRDGVDVLDSALNWGGGNLDVDPAFVDAPGGDLRVGPQSRVINAGDPDIILPEASLDFDGQARTMFGITDIGADEAAAFDDCDGDGRPDWRSARDGSDCNENAIPDECEDCNGNGLADECDLSSGASLDCNRNRIPDDCEALSFVLISSSPPDGAIDAAQPFDLAGTAAQGWRAVELAFDFDIAEAELADFSVSQQGGAGTPPAIRAVERMGFGTVRVTLDRPMQPGGWTTITHNCSKQSVRLGFLPGDVNSDATTNPAIDLTALIDCINLSGCEPWQADIDRSGGSPGVLDLTRLIDLLNGAGAYESWAGRSLP